MPMVEIDSEKLAQLKRDAKLTLAVRKSVAHGARPTLTRPLQTINMILEGVTPEDRDAVQKAWTAAVSQSR